MQKTLIVVLLVVVVTLAGVMVYQNWLQPVPVVNNNQSPVSDETANWKILKGDSYEIKYPQDFIIQPNGMLVNSSCAFGIVKPYNNDEITDLLNKGYTETKVIVDGRPAQKLEKLTQPGAMQAVYFTSSTGIPIRIDSESGQSNSPECVNLFNKFISTFKFTK